MWITTFIYIDIVQHLYYWRTEIIYSFLLQHSIVLQSKPSHNTNVNRVCIIMIFLTFTFFELLMLSTYNIVPSQNLLSPLVIFHCLKCFEKTFWKSDCLVTAGILACTSMSSKNLLQHEFDLFKSFCFTLSDFKFDVISGNEVELLSFELSCGCVEGVFAFDWPDLRETTGCRYRLRNLNGIFILHFELDYFIIKSFHIITSQ